MKVVKTDGASWAGKTLVLPGGNSMGFTSELAIDALITHSNATRCGYLQSEIFLPVALPNCFGTGGVTTGTEFYEAGDLIILQLRAPYATASGKHELAAFLVTLKEEEKLKDMLCIATVSAHLRTDEDLRCPAVLRVVNFTEGENADHLPELREWQMCLQYGGGVSGPLADHGVKVLAIFAMDAVEIATAETLTAAAKKCLTRSSPELCQFMVKHVQSWTPFLQLPPKAIY
eukprot:GEMP01075194.1.p1 GENE.GEMP01075194.1~~GEMP01075194.1.p1  ORF type:complete len:231 (+),score=56.11 GEMP01075194.1:74-766(+)